MSERVRWIHEHQLLPRGNNFNAVRFVLASCVIWTHCYWLVHDVGGQDEFQALIGLPISHLAVNGFFFVSGMLVSQSMLRQPDALHFGAMRVGRIWPGLMMCVLVTIIGYAVLSGNVVRYLTHQETIKFIGMNLIQVKGFYTLPTLAPNDGTMVVNGSLWTITWELRCYLVLALFYLLAPQARSRAVVILALVTLPLCLGWTLARELMTDFPDFSNRVLYYAGNSARLWGCFAIGMLAGIGWRHIPIVPAALVPLWLVVFVEYQVLGTRLAVSPVLLYTVLVAAFGQRGDKVLSANWPDFSYGIYIYAFPVMIALQYVLGFQTHASLALANFVMALFLAALSWFVVEKPALGHVKRRMRAWRRDVRFDRERRRGSDG